MPPRYRSYRTRPSCRRWQLATGLLHRGSSHSKVSKVSHFARILYTYRSMYPFPKKAYLFTQAFLDLDQLLSTFYVVRILSDFLSSGIFGSGFAYMYANVHKAQNFHHHYERISQKFERLIFQTNIREVHSIPKHNNTSYFRLTNKLT